MTPTPDMMRDATPDTMPEELQMQDSETALHTEPRGDFSAQPDDEPGLFLRAIAAAIPETWFGAAVWGLLILGLAQRWPEASATIYGLVIWLVVAFGPVVQAREAARWADVEEDAIVPTPRVTFGVDAQPFLSGVQSAREQLEAFMVGPEADVEGYRPEREERA